MEEVGLNLVNPALLVQRAEPDPVVLIHFPVLHQNYIRLRILLPNPEEGRLPRRIDPVVGAPEHDELVQLQNVLPPLLVVIELVVEPWQIITMLFVPVNLVGVPPVVRQSKVVLKYWFIPELEEELIDNRRKLAENHTIRRDPAEDSSVGVGNSD